MGRFWSLLFLAVPVLGVAVFALAAGGIWPFDHHWFPEDISERGYIIDDLFNFIMYLTGAIFVATGLAMFVFLWKYDAHQTTKPVKFVHGSHVLEIVWSILPAATLLFIAIFQRDTWAGNKIERPALLPGPDGIVGTPDDSAAVEVTGRQFEWRIRYAGRDQILGTPDDLYTVNDLHLPVNEEAAIAIKSMDVLHSFFLPNVRVKQDVVPGMKQYVWFKPTKDGQYDIVCAELCGWGHYKMKGRLTVESRDKYEQWLNELESEHRLSVFQPSEEE
jgi:cytochrome c oxidase subunit 2